MRLIAMIILLALASAGLTGCSRSFATRVDERTYDIEGPQVPGGSDAPNRRLAEQLCPRGYRVIEESRRKPQSDAQIQTCRSKQSGLSPLAG